MKQPPRDPKQSIIDKRMQLGIVLQTIAMTAAVLGAFKLALNIYGTSEEGIYIARNFAFVTLIVSELFRSFTARSEIFSIFKLGLLSNKYVIGGTLISLVMLLGVMYIPFLQPTFETMAFNVKHWTYVLGFALIPSIAAEITKAFIRVKEAKANHL